MNRFKLNLLTYDKKNFIVRKEKIKDKIIETKIKKLKSMDSLITSLSPNTLAPPRAGIESKNAILVESILLKFKYLAAVNVIPERLTPGINAKI